MAVSWSDLTKEQRDQVVVEWDGMEVPYQRILDTATKFQTTPDVIEHLGTWQGKLMSRVADTMVGRGFLRAAQGAEDVAYTGLELTAKAGFAPKGFLEKVQANRAKQAEFDDFITRGGQTEEILGPVGARIFDGAIRSSAKFAIPGGVGLQGTKALGTIYGMAAAESGNDAHNQALEAGASESEALLYAAKRAFVDAGVMFLMGRFATSKGLSTLEEGLSPGMRAAAQRVLNKNGVADDLAAMVKSIGGGAGVEAIEESTQDALGQIMEMGSGYRDAFNWQQNLEAGLTGAVAAGTTQSISTLAEKLNGLQPEIENAVIGTAAAEAFVPQATSEQIEAVLQTTGIKDLQEAMPGLEIKNAQQAEAVRAEVERQAAEMKRDADMVTELVAKPGQDVTLRGVPEPTNAKEAVAAASGVMTARTYQELHDIAQRYGQEGYYSPGRLSQAVVDAEIRKAGLHTKDSVAKMVDEVMLNPGTLDVHKQEAMTIRGADIEGALLELSQKIGQAESPGQIANFEAEMDALGKELARIGNALQLGGTPAAQLMAFRRLGQTAQWGPMGAIASATTAKKAPLSDAERIDVVKDATELQHTTKALEAVEEAARDDRAMEGLKDANTMQATEDLMTLYEKANQLLTGGCDL